jgi:hypothetical protein
MGRDQSAGIGSICARGWALTGKRMQVNVGVPSEFAEVDHHERGYSADNHVQCSNYWQKSQ